MIAVRLQGRLGNQLFQYAFALYAAGQLNTPFYLDQYLERSSIHQYFDIDTNKAEAFSLYLSSISGFRNIFNFRGRRFFNRAVNNYYGLKIKEYPFANIDPEIDLEDNTLYIGYFQSAYFAGAIKQLLRKKLSLKKNHTDNFNKKFNTLYRDKNIVTIHIRQTDFKALGHLNLGADDLSLPLSYYKNALTAISKDINTHYIFISDSPEFVEQNFGDVTPKIISRESEITDFQHMLNADICITSNSTFSWWAAWLNIKANKKVYCPKYYMGFHLKQQVPQNIYPANWNQIDFEC